MRILLVDDDPGILELVSQFLTLSTHHEAVPASSAKEALETISRTQEPFDCVLADIQMPEVDGIALVKMIRATPGYGNTPVIMLTAMQDKHHLDRAFAAGASDYLAKPFDFPELQRRLREVQMLAVAKIRAQTARPAAGDFRAMGDDTKTVALRDPVALTEVAAAIDYAEFENYLRQLLHRRVAPVTAIAVKIDKIDRVYAAATTAKFRTFLRQAAETVAAVLLAEGGVLSYRGRGIFLCIPENPVRARRASLQKVLNQRYRALLAPAGEVAPKLLLGDPQPLANRTQPEALDTLARAIESVESHALAAADMFVVHGRLMKQQRFNEEQRQLEKRAFETLLRDPDTPPADDAWTRRLNRRSGRGAGR